MAVELEKFIKNQLDSLPSNHPDKEYLSGLLADTESYNAGDDRDVIPLTDIDRTVVLQAAKEYQSKPHTPELVTQVFQTIWRERGKLVGAAYEVTPCPYTQEELTDLEQQSRRVGYLPKELATQKSRHLLGKMFPNMGSYSVGENNLVTNDENPSGWFDYEAGVDAPYLNTDEKQLTERIAQDKRKPLTLNQYIVAGQDSKLLTGQYLDEARTWTRLGSRGGGRVVSAYFSQDGYLGVDWFLRSDDHSRGLGGRSSGVKKA